MAAKQATSVTARKARGAFFTPPEIAEFLARWAIAEPDDRVLDPTCGEAVFLLAAAERLRAVGADPAARGPLLTGIDIDAPSLAESCSLLHDKGVDAPNLINADFFATHTPAQIGSKIGWQDAVVGNPPFVRYQAFSGDVRRRALAAALAQGVRLSKQTSSWAPTLVHASAFLKPSGRLAMVVPAELLTVHYAEPIRRWLRQRFAVVNLVMFERLQFHGADEQVVLLVAHGQGTCDSFSLYHVDDASELAEVHPLDVFSSSPAAEGKWSDLALSLETRQLFRRVTARMEILGDYGKLELGTVTGANDYFTMSEATRHRYDIDERHLKRLSPPGTRHLRSLSFTHEQWEELKLTGKRVWLLHPSKATQDRGVMRYIRRGERLKVNKAYKCTVRKPWWRPPVVAEPDLFFTYMSHRFPRLIANSAGTTLVNSMHGVRVRQGLKREARDALPLLALNSATLLGAEVLGRSYGGGILKMEPREAAGLPMPCVAELQSAWKTLKSQKDDLDISLQQGEWEAVVTTVDGVLLEEEMGLTTDEVSMLRDAGDLLRARRTRKSRPRER
ncbi:MAG TPA: N-6 DNA methylase [Solirubrobacterales bacterium]|nr:N-6 DNA methylase [Solirubrobacterales bacterium]